MLREGILIAGSHNVCFSHGNSDIDLVTDAYDMVLKNIRHTLDQGAFVENMDVAPIYPVFQVRG